MSKKPRFLTQKQAELRYSCIVKNSIEYNLQLRLNEPDTYSGVLDISFVTKNSTNDLFLDYKGSNIKKVTYNGKEIQKLNNTYQNIWNGQFIQVPLCYLVNGRNFISIYFENNYTNDGLGLHSFIDTDKKQYIYSQCQTFWCNRIFPCFDQPDLKATLNLSLIGPRTWILLSNESPIIQQTEFSMQKYKQDLQSNQSKLFLDEFLIDIPEENNYQYCIYSRTQILPTYLYGFIAGPFLEIKCQKSHKNIPMSIYCRESLFHFLQKISEFIFEITNESMKLFEEFFGYPYPFSKYDQIFVPEFNAGAMENAGLVTFNDLYIFKESVTETRFTNLGITITHELSHHWFGNLVTMKWWNDLWLNESFAVFISHFIMYQMDIKSVKLVDIWVKFNANKSWGYRADQLITTHPIACQIENTEAASSIFDGISYSKGSATIRQLLALIGEEAFSNSLKTYFRKFAFSNANLNDFIEVLNEEFQKINPPFTLDEWQQKWIQTAGLNEFEPIFDRFQKSKESVLKICQRPTLQQHPTLRKHKIKIAFFEEDGKVTSLEVLLEDKEEIEVYYNGAEKEFQAVLLNYQDLSFMKVLLDNFSVRFFKQNLHKINERLTRNIIWRAFFDMVRDAKISSKEYLEMFMNVIPNEICDEIITNQLNFLLIIYQQFIPRQYQEQEGIIIFEFLVSYLLKIPEENKNRIIMIKSKLDSFAKADQHIQYLLSWYQGENQDLKKFELGNSIEWRIVSLVHKSKKYSKDFKKQLFNQQVQKDQSDIRYSYEHKCNALIATPEEKEQLWDYYINYDGKISIRNMEYSFSGFNSSFDYEEREPYYKKFFDSIISIYEKQNRKYANLFFNYLFPKSQDWDRLINDLNDLKNKLNDQWTNLKKLIDEKIDGILRKQKTQKCYIQNISS